MSKDKVQDLILEVLDVSKFFGQKLNLQDFMLEVEYVIKAQGKIAWHPGCSQNIQDGPHSSWDKKRMSWTF